MGQQATSHGEPPLANWARGCRALVIVAHPDDETLWAGGMMLSHPEMEWFVIALCRGSDPDRAPKFARALIRLRAAGQIADLDDGVEQTPLPDQEVRESILTRLPEGRFDLVMTHGPDGEYTRHRRHEETSRAVTQLWAGREIAADSLWYFAYTDRGATHLPRAAEDASVKMILPWAIWQEKHMIIKAVYGFGPDSFEARTTPRAEAFHCFDSWEAACPWSERKGEVKA